MSSQDFPKGRGRSILVYIDVFWSRVAVLLPFDDVSAEGLLALEGKELDRTQEDGAVCHWLANYLLLRE